MVLLASKAGRDCRLSALFGQADRVRMREPLVGNAANIQPGPVQNN